MDSQAAAEPRVIRDDTSYTLCKTRWLNILISFICVSVYCSKRYNIENYWSKVVNGKNVIEPHTPVLDVSEKNTANKDWSLGGDKKVVQSSNSDSVKNISGETQKLPKLSNIEAVDRFQQAQKLVDPHLLAEVRGSDLVRALRECSTKEG